MPLSKLNIEQKDAALAPFGHNLIIASAGTGKTSTIVARIGYLLSLGVKPEEILLLTFTNKASAQMIERVGRFYDTSVVQKIEAGTFHAVSYRLLKKYGKNIILKQPKELKTVLKSIVEKRAFWHIDTKTKPYTASYLYDLYSLFQNISHSKGFGDWIGEKNPDQGEFADIYEDIFIEFEETKEKFGYVDFNDLLLKMKNFLNQERVFFKEILVDEYQDTNPLQGTLIESFAYESLFCVGDYDQSIYAFNGSDMGIIGGFKDRYLDARVFALNKNYRSTHLILSIANKVIEKNPRIYKKSLEVTRTDSRIPPKLLIFDNLFSQYQEIAARIKSSLCKREEIAIIFRNNSSADGMEASLRECGISCKRRGGSGFFDTKEVRLILDIFTILLNSKDLMSFVHIFEYAKGIGPSLAKEMFDALFKLGDGDVIRGLFEPNDTPNPFKRERVSFQLGLFDHFETGSMSRFKKDGIEENIFSHPILKHPKMTQEGVEFINRFYKFIKKTKNIKLPKTLIKTILESEIFDDIAENLARKRATLKDGSMDENQKNQAKERIRAKGMLLEELSQNYSQAERFLNAMTLGQSEMSEGEGVNLLTVHASKGLEFQEVYVIDLMEGRFPNQKLVQKGGSIEEERRLFYVAVTRAKDVLYLSYAKWDEIKKIDYAPSTFLKEAGLIGSN